MEEDLGTQLAHDCNTPMMVEGNVECMKNWILTPIHVQDKELHVPSSMFNLVFPSD